MSLDKDYEAIQKKRPGIKTDGNRIEVDVPWVKATHIRSTHKKKEADRVVNVRI